MTTVSRIAYLTALYPAVSHTFILREVEAVRDLGIDVITCSIRRSEPGSHQGPAEQAADASTYYVLKAAKNPLVILRALVAGLKTPGRYLRALKLAYKTAQPGARGMLYQMFYFAEATVLAKHLKDEGATHLHNHFADHSANVAMLTSAISDIPFSYTLHGPAELYEPLRWQLREKTTRAKFVACISHFCRSQAMYFSDPAHWGKLRIVHCGVLPEIYDTPRAPQGGTNLVFVGRLTAIKGVRVLLKAFAQARETRPDLHLTLVGDGDERANLERLTAPLGDAVEFLGYKSQSEVAEVLAKSDALVLPSFAEGLPVVLMEAMASGLPVITTRVAGVAELVEDGINGHLVHASDEASLAQQIGLLADSADKGSDMGQKGRAKVMEEFDIRIEAARIAALFMEQGGDDPRPVPYAPGTYVSGKGTS